MVKNNFGCSVTIVSREMLPKADYVGSVSGATNKLNNFMQ